jgi:dihydroflavonol-4-reductase
MELWAKHVTRSEPLATLKSIQYLQRKPHFDVTKARRELDLPCTPFEASIQRAVAYFREHNMA